MGWGNRWRAWRRPAVIAMTMGGYHGAMAFTVLSTALILEFLFRFYGCQLRGCVTHGPDVRHAYHLLMAAYHHP